MSQLVFIFVEILMSEKHGDKEMRGFVKELLTLDYGMAILNFITGCVDHVV